MDLRVIDSIDIQSVSGVQKIELCYGDITTLPVEDKVDVLMISAFPGDYSAMHGTVIGALKHKLDIDVSALALNKEMDMRIHFSCWLSKPLPSQKPYGKILCFERNRGSVPVVQQIRDVFRIFVPAFRYEETSVITPLLGAGHQNFSEVNVLRAMVDSAASWIYAGLPLKLLKLVVYKVGNTKLEEVFAQLKLHWTKKFLIQELKEKKLKFDVFIAYRPEDVQYVKKIEKFLKSVKTDLKIYSDVQIFDENKVWQDNIYNVMVRSTMILAVLTPLFVDNPDCLEIFNMAICCNRLHGKEILYPFYILSAKSMPIYMTHVQYYDCRIRKEGDSTDDKIKEACLAIIAAREEQSGKSPSSKEMDVSKYEYDVFVSYSHKNPQQAQTIVNAFNRKFPDLKVFYDRNELSMGGKWQESLYYSIDSAQCVILLMSPTYMSSVICKEEYNISLARYMKHPDNVLLIPVCVQEIDSIPWSYGQVQLLDGRGDNFDELLPFLTDGVGSWFKSSVRPDFLPSVKLNQFDLCHQEKQREERMNRLYNVDTKKVKFERKITPEYVQPDDNRVSISFSSASTNLAVCLGHMMVEKIRNLNINFVDNSISSGIQSLETSKRIVVLLNDQYTQSAINIEELLVSIIRQRANNEDKFLYICHVDKLPEKPMFIHLLPCDLSLQDQFWDSYRTKGSCDKDSVHFVSKLPALQGSFSCSTKEYAAMSKLAVDVLDGFTIKPEALGPVPIISNVFDLMAITPSENGTSVLKPSDYLIPMDFGSRKVNKKESSENQNAEQKNTAGKDEKESPKNEGAERKNTSENPREKSEKQMSPEHTSNEDKRQGNENKENVKTTQHSTSCTLV